MKEEGLVGKWGLTTLNQKPRVEDKESASGLDRAGSQEQLKAASERELLRRRRIRLSDVCLNLRFACSETEPSSHLDAHGS